MNGWLVLKVFACVVLIVLLLLAAQSGTTWTVHAPGFNVVLPGVRLR